MASLNQCVFDKGTASLFDVTDTQLRLREHLPSVTEHCLEFTDFARVVAGNDQARWYVHRH